MLRISSRSLASASSASAARVGAWAHRATRALATTKATTSGASGTPAMGVAFALPEDIRHRVLESPLAPTYDPAAVEQGWHEYWQRVIREKHRLRSRGGKAEDDGRPGTFAMLLPPPNVTGALHIGHALTITIQDALARWHHMRGFDVRWIPGLDHAGIATQSVVERKLMKEEGRTKHDLGREAFIDRVWDWNEQYGGRIVHQIDRLGAVVDKDQTFFTLDETRSKAVIEAFVQLHERGLIHRKRRMVNWCPTLKTAISDIEVDNESLTGPTMMKLPGRTKPVEFGVMHRILYKVTDSEDHLEVDTTRPETLFGDVAVAVHPDDERYKRYHGKYVVHPLSGKHIPVVTDDVLVNMELGTGVVKVTPAHDPKDYECGLRLNLPEMVVIDNDGRMCGEIDEKYRGLDRFEARERVIEELKELNLYVEKLSHPTTLSLCSRSSDVIEPLLMPQWFVDCRTMAQRAVDQVREGKLLIEPKSHEHMWYYFLENIREWCVSRQLWWGHRIPAYRARVPGIAREEWIVARSEEEARQKATETFSVECDAIELTQDDDVLDTWFSSGLLPVSVSGWPDDNPTACSGYPLSVMETGSDILFFWVARMAMLCEEFSGQMPFKRVLLHPMVRDKSGRKMSKSLGNVIDPIHVINGISLDMLLEGLQSGNVDQQEMKKAQKELKREFPNGIPPCGTDALRYALASYLQQGRQINMDLQRVVSHRHFCNKIWNAVRYALPLLESQDSAYAQELAVKDVRPHMSLADRWILSRLAEVVVEVNKGMETNQLASSVSAFHRFFVQEFCDVFIEISKPVLYGNRVEVSDVESREEFRQRQLASRVALFTCLDLSMRLMHPFAPFVTEELWQRIRTYNPLWEDNVDTSILLSKYPEYQDVNDWVDPSAESSMQFVLSIIHAVRSLKHTVKTLAPSGAQQKEDVAVEVASTSMEDINILHETIQDIEGQCRVAVRFHQSGDINDPPMGGHVLSHSISQTCKVWYPVPEDPETPQRVNAEIQRLEKRTKKLQDSLAGLQRRLNQPGYSDKVPEAIQMQDATRVAQLETDIDTTMRSIEVLEMLRAQY